MLLSKSGLAYHFKGIIHVVCKMLALYLLNGTLGGFEQETHMLGVLEEFERVALMPLNNIVPIDVYN